MTASSPRGTFSQAELTRERAQHSQFFAARQLLDEAAAAAMSPACWAMEKAGVLMARTEVEWLAGAPDQAEASLRAALEIYEDRRIVPLADLARAALAGLATAHGEEQP